MKSLLIVPTLASILLAVPGVSHADVDLAADARARLGIKTEPLQTVSAAPAYSAVGTVLDASTLVSALGDVRAAEEAAMTSNEEFHRADALFKNDTNVARKTRDAARTQSTADEAKLATSQMQLLASWGPAIAAMKAPARAALIADLLAGRAALVRADLLRAMPAGAAVERAELSTLDADRHWSATVLGPLPLTTPSSWAGALLVKVPAAMTAGEPLQIALLGASRAAVVPVVPQAAIVRWHGSAWVYEEKPQNHFIRREVRPSLYSEGRLVVPQGLAPGARLVTVGARALLAAETSAASAEDHTGG